MPPLVCLHGWCCDAWHFDPQVAYFSPVTEICSIPWRSRVEASGQEATLGLAVREIESACREHDLGAPPVLVGHSMGGLLAARIAAEGRLSVAGIVIIDATYPMGDDARSQFGDVLTRLRADFEATTRDFFSNRLVIPQDDPGITARVIDGVMAVDPQVAIDLFADITSPGSMPPVESIDVPILGIGSSRPFLPREALLEGSARASYGQVVGSGHMIMLQVPDQLNAMLDRFLAMR